MSYEVAQPWHIIVAVNGLVLLPGIDYNVSGTTLNFTAAPNNTSDIEIRYFGATGESGFKGSQGSTGYTGSVGSACFKTCFITIPPIHLTSIIWHQFIYAIQK